ncbi:hypothetical protein BDV3_003647 [Batrachochytrium dendrobatidis]|nr:hypothetical protein O5D80_002204 [Batrachochytrium dendrobatidis]KAK5669535.1 hypothetical protein QVD99_003926 [Batrachochytrium dendrobatidis]
MNCNHSNCSDRHSSDKSLDYSQSLLELEFDKSIHSAAQSNNRTRLTSLLSRSNPIQLANQLDSAGYSPLHYAARQGHLDVCKLLIQAGADINYATLELHTTSLHRAVVGGHVHIVQYLIDMGADIHRVDLDGRTPLSLAVKAGHEHIVHILNSCS